MPKTTCLRIGTGLVIFLLTCGVLVISPASAEDAAGKQVALTTKTGDVALAAFTPSKALTGGKPFRITGDSGTLSVAGTDVKFGVLWNAGLKAFFAAMDVNGNGTLDPGEYAKLSQTLSATFQVKVGDKVHAVRVADLSIMTKGTGNIGGSTISTVAGGYFVCSFQQGTCDGTMIRLFDDNLDGTFTQDGKDAIMIGKSPVAIPLMKVHQIGTQFCTLEVATDGSQVTVTPVSGLQLGAVETCFKRGLKCLAMTDEQGNSVDLAASGRTGIPAGKYRMVYGVLSDGAAVTVIKPTEQCPVYEIQAGKINTLRLGKPLWVSFAATGSVSTNVTVTPRVKVYGAAGEEYSSDLSGGTGRPHVQMYEGKKLVQDVAMSYG
jgi:hypothetical protein